MNLFLNIILIIYLYAALIFANLLLISNIAASVRESRLWDSNFLRHSFIICLITPIIFIVYFFFSRPADEDWQTTAYIGWGYGAITLPFYYFLVAGLFLILHQIRKKWYKIASVIDLLRDKSPILFLRSFHQNYHIKFPRASATTLEKVPFGDGFMYKMSETEFPGRSIVPIISNAVKPYGTMVMYGKEETGSIQAGNFVELHSTDENWFENVQVICKECLAIIFIPSESPSLKQELEFIITSDLLQKTIFILPPVLSTFGEVNASSLEERWNRELIHIMDSLGYFLPNYPHEGRIFVIKNNKELLYDKPFLNSKNSELKDNLKEHFAEILQFFPKPADSNFTKRSTITSVRKSMIELGKNMINGLLVIAVCCVLFLLLPGLGIFLFVWAFGKIGVFTNEHFGFGVTMVVLFILILVVRNLIDKLFGE